MKNHETIIWKSFRAALTFRKMKGPLNLLKRTLLHVPLNSQTAALNTSQLMQEPIILFLSKAIRAKIKAILK